MLDIGGRERLLLTRTEGRIALTRHNPLLFAYIYLPEHITSENASSSVRPGDAMTLSEFHLELLEYARTWEEPLGARKEYRDCFIAPRSSGKTTWLFLILPMWAAAHGHKRFIAAFSDSAPQAEGHLSTFKTELETNERLRLDFPDLCEPAKGTNVGRYLMNNRNQIKQANGFVFMARGADTKVLGMKVGNLRPDVLLFDDIESGESSYSAAEVRKRLDTLVSDLFALNDWARVCIIGTTTMPGSIIDQMRKFHEYKQRYDGDDMRNDIDAELRWIIDQNIDTHFWPAILTNEDGEERSFWPERFPLDNLNADRHTRDFAKNMMNRPISLEAGYWLDDDIEIKNCKVADGEEPYPRTILSVDPAVTTARASDYTGLAVVSRGADGQVYVRHAEQVKLGSSALRDRVIELIEEYDVKVVYVETNQGGDLWKQVFEDVPAKFRSVRQREKKELRATRALDFYRKGRIFHTKHMSILEEQMLAFPKLQHDDVVDAVVSGILYFLSTESGGIAVKQLNYLGR